MTDVDKSAPILIVNGQINVRKVLKTCLMQLGFNNLAEAESEKAALTQVQSQTFNLVISDWDIANNDSVELLKYLRSDYCQSKTPFLMLTANAERDKIVEAVKAGVSNYLMKPFTPDQLESKLDVILAPQP